MNANLPVRLPQLGRFRTRLTRYAHQRAGGAELRRDGVEDRHGDRSPIRFETISDEEARKQQVAWGAPPELVEARLSIFRAIRDGKLATVTDTVERVLARRPATFDTWARENAGAFHQ